LISHKSEWSIVRISQDEWYENWEKVVKATMIQSWEYGEAKKSQGWNPQRYGIVNEDDRVVGILQIMLKTLPFIGGVARINRGPLFLQGNELGDEQEKTLSNLLLAMHKFCKEERIWLLSWAPEYHMENSYHDILKKHGHVANDRANPWGSILLDIQVSEDSIFTGLNGKWRNLLRKAQKLNNDIRSVKDMDGIEDIVKIYNQFQHQKGFSGIPEKLLSSILFEYLATNNLSVLKSIDTSGSIDGFVITIFSGDTATYLAGWSSDKGRRDCVNYGLLWESILISKKRGIAFFDLGGLNNTTPKGIQHFKKGLNGIPYSLVGEYKFWPMFNSIK
jgi:lipid II:glycine glycyltransferase (peptidoglycan interpeptide bridge formation enzyme)